MLENFPQFSLLIERTGWLLIHSLWQFALWALIALVLLKCLRRMTSTVRYTASVCILLLMTMTPVVTWSFLPDVPPSVAQIETEGIENAPPPVEPRAETIAPAAQDRLPSVTTRIERTASAGATADAEAFGEANSESSHHNESGWLTTWSTEIQQTLEPWLTWIVGVWFAGMLLFSLRPLAGWITMRRLSRMAISDVPENILRLLRETSKRLGIRKAVSIFQSSLVSVPLVTGFLRPMILLPASVVTGFPPAQLQAILAHELAHIRRYDQLVNLWQTLVETIFFYHPLVWWLSHQIRCERENCCDDLAASVTGGKVAYSRALLALDELRSTSSALALSSHGGSLSSRIRRLVTGESNSYRAGLLGVVALVILLGGVAACFLWWNPQEQAAASTENETEPPMSPEELAAWDALGEIEGLFSHDLNHRRHFKRHLQTLERHSFPEETLNHYRAELERPVRFADFMHVPEEAWPYIVKLESLRRLSITATDVRGRPMEYLSQMKNLQSITIDFGQCVPEDLVHLKHLPNLERIEVAITVLGKSKDDWLRQRGELTETEQEKLDELLIPQPPANRRLDRELVIVALHTDRAIRELSELKKLRSLKLRNTFATDASLEALSNCPELEELELSILRAPEKAPKSIGEISALRSFSQSPADNETLKELSTLANLEHLDVWADGVTSEGVPHLLKLKNLTRLEIRGNHLDDAGLTQLAQLPKLEYLDIRFPEGALTLAGVLAFQEKKPDCLLEVDDDLPLGPGGAPVFVEEEEEMIPPHPRDAADIDAPLRLQVSRKNPPDWAVPCDGNTPWLKQLPAFLSDNTFITVGGGSSQLEIHDPKDGSTLRTLPAGGRKLHSLRISDDGRSVAYISRPPFDPSDPTRVEFSALVVVRKLPSLELVGTPVDSEIVWNQTLAISTNGKFVAFSNANNPNGVSVWEVESGNEIKEYPDWIDSIMTMAFSPDGRWLVISSLGDLMFWEWQTEKPPQKIHVGRHTWSLGFSPDSRYLYEGYDSRREIQVRDLKTMKVVRRFKDDTGHSMSVKNLQFTDNGKTLVAGNAIGFNWQKLIVNDRLHFWDIETGKILRKFDFTRHEVYSVAVSPNGRYLVAVLWDLDEVLLAGWDLTKTARKTTPDKP